MTASKQANSACETPRAEKIAQLNDALRKRGEGGQVMITANLQATRTFDADKLVALVARYDAFDADNDPHGERDFGDVDMDGTTVFWKIDYYDKQLQYGSNDPADPSVTQRVLTLMLPEDW